MRCKVWFVLISVLALVLASSTMAQTSLDPTIEADIEALIEQTLNEVQVPGFAINIIHDGEFVYSRGFGVRTLGAEASVSPRTVFQMHSISKSFTATAVMQLVEQGKIDLEAPVTEYLPHFRLDDARYEAITVRQLLSHTAGLGGLYAEEFGPIPANYWYAFSPEFDEGSLERYIHDLTASPLQFDPGEAWAYSDVGFNVLGEVVAKVSGMTFEAYLQQNILTPLGLTSTTFLLDEVDRDVYASPHIRNDAGAVMVSEVIPYHRPFAGSMNLYSTVDDLTRWARTHLNGGELDGVRILSAESQAQLWTQQAETGIDFWLVRGYGFGWFVTEHAGHRIIFNPGADLGSNANVYLAPDDGYAIVAAGNFFHSFEEIPGYADDLVGAIMDLLLGIEE